MTTLAIEKKYDKYFSDIDFDDDRLLRKCILRYQSINNKFYLEDDIVEYINQKNPFFAAKIIESLKPDEKKKWPSNRKKGLLDISIKQLKGKKDDQSLYVMLPRVMYYSLSLYDRGTFSELTYEVEKVQGIRKVLKRFVELVDIGEDVQYRAKYFLSFVISTLFYKKPRSWETFDPRNYIIDQLQIDPTYLSKNDWKSVFNIAKENKSCGIFLKLVSKVSLDYCASENNIDMEDLLEAHKNINVDISHKDLEFKEYYDIAHAYHRYDTVIEIFYTLEYIHNKQTDALYNYYLTLCLMHNYINTGKIESKGSSIIKEGLFRQDIYNDEEINRLLSKGILQMRLSSRNSEPAGLIYTTYSISPFNCGVFENVNDINKQYWDDSILELKDIAVDLVFSLFLTKKDPKYIADFYANSFIKTILDPHYFLRMCKRHVEEANEIKTALSEINFAGIIENDEGCHPKVTLFNINGSYDIPKNIPLYGSTNQKVYANVDFKNNRVINITPYTTVKDSDINYHETKNDWTSYINFLENVSSDNSIMEAIKNILQTESKQGKSATFSPFLRDLKSQSALVLDSEFYNSFDRFLSVCLKISDINPFVLRFLLNSSVWMGHFSNKRRDSDRGIPGFNYEKVKSKSLSSKVKSILKSMSRNGMNSILVLDTYYNTIFRCVLPLEEAITVSVYQSLHKKGNHDKILSYVKSTKMGFTAKSEEGVVRLRYTPIYDDPLRLAEPLQKNKDVDYVTISDVEDYEIPNSKEPKKSIKRVRLIFEVHYK